MAISHGIAPVFSAPKYRFDHRCGTPSLFPLTVKRSFSKNKIHGCSSVTPICKIASDVAVSIDSARSSSISALKKLKISSPDRYTKEKSSIIVIGLNVHSTPVEIREKLALEESEWPQAIQELCNLNHIQEAAILSTCNRMEIYVLALSPSRGVKEVTEWMSKSSGVPMTELCKHRFLLYNEDATNHLFEVSSGLDSLVLGEGQILAQVKQVVKNGQGLEGFGTNISELFKHAIKVGKRVRTETSIASGAISISSSAVELAMKKFPQTSLAKARILVVGAGKMGKLVIKHLAAKGCRKMVVVNRSEERVEAIREEMKMKDIEIIYKPLTELYDCTIAADVVFTSTSSKIPLFLKEHVENLGGSRLFVDISVPRNVGACVADLETTEVYNVDDLKEVVEANKEDRLRKAMEARTIINEEISQFEAWRDSLQTTPTIKKLRSSVDRIAMAEMEKCLSKCGDGLTNDQRKAIDGLRQGIVNKILHGPMQHLRCDGNDNHSLKDTLENMHVVNRMFNLGDESADLMQKIQAKLEQTHQ